MKPLENVWKRLKTLETLENAWKRLKRWKCLKTLENAWSLLKTLKRLIVWMPENKTTSAIVSDAVLNCPACFTVVCLDCQRHELYKTQYRYFNNRNFQNLTSLINDFFTQILYAQKCFCFYVFVRALNGFSCLCVEIKLVKSMSIVVLLSEPCLW